MIDLLNLSNYWTKMEPRYSRFFIFVNRTQITCKFHFIWIDGNKNISTKCTEHVKLLHLV